MSRTTIAIQTQTRTRLKAGAQREAMTIDAYLRSLLDARDQDQFWSSFQDVTPQSYAAAVGVDMPDEDYSVEDAAIDAEEA